MGCGAVGLRLLRQRVQQQESKKWPLELGGSGVSCSVVSDSLRSHGLYSSPGFSVHGILQAVLLEWVAIPFSRGSSKPRDWTQVSHIAGRFFTFWATREASFWAYWPINISINSKYLVAIMLFFSSVTSRFKICRWLENNQTVVDKLNMHRGLRYGGSLENIKTKQCTKKAFEKGHIYLKMNEWKNIMILA